MNCKIENAIEITWIVTEHIHKGRLLCTTFPYTELKDFIGELTEKFEFIHSNSDWDELDYNEEIQKFANKELAKELWGRFGDVPMNPETEKIEEEWNSFPAGTWREDIWHWFEDTFSISVAEDLMRL